MKAHEKKEYQHKLYLHLRGETTLPPDCMPYPVKLFDESGWEVVTRIRIRSRQKAWQALTTLPNPIHEIQWSDGVRTFV